MRKFRLLIVAFMLFMSVTPALAQTPATQVKPRFVGVFFPHGMAPGFWEPKSEGPLTELPRIAEALAKVKEDSTILSGLWSKSAEPPEGTAEGLLALHVQDGTGDLVDVGDHSLRIQHHEAVVDALEDVRFTYNQAKIGPSRILLERDMPSLAESLPAKRGIALDIQTFVET